MEITIKDMEHKGIGKAFRLNIENLEVDSVTELNNLLKLIYFVRNNLMKINDKRINELTK